MGNILQRILVLFGFKRTDEPPEFTNIQSVATHVEQPKHISDSGKQYSWDKRRAQGNQDANSWKIQGVNDSVALRLPGSLSGNDLDIQNCSDSRIYVFDHSSQIIVDKCENCKFIFAAVKGSVFFRNCNNCSFIVASTQFRTRDCNNCKFFVYCETIPIIEATENATFHCMQLSYNGLKQHMKNAGLSCFNNNWSTIHDFTPNHDSPNYKFVAPPHQDISFLFPIEDLSDATLQALDICFEAEKSCVPSTVGISVGYPVCAMIVIPPAMTQIQLSYFLSSELCKKHSDIKLKQAIYQTLSSEDVHRIFEKDLGKLSESSLTSGDVIFLIVASNTAPNEIQGVFNDVFELAKEQLKKLPTYEFFTDKAVIEEIQRFAASKISG